MQKEARFSECGAFRFWLSRTWSMFDHRSLMLIGLNPSTANATQDDPTIRRIVSLANANGYGRIVMTNLFPFITPYPEVLKTESQYMDLNNEVLRAQSRQCNDICFCWGNFNFPERIYEVVEMFPDALCFGKNKNGSPKHPLYLKSETKLVKWSTK